MLNLSKKQIGKLAITFVISGVLTYLFCKFVLTPQYQAETEVYPSNVQSYRDLLGAGLRFGGDKETGELMSILGSNDVRDSIIERFDLIEHYEIDTTETFWKHNLNQEYQDNISVSRTINKSISISVWDKSPTYASEIANAIVAIADAHKSFIIKENIRSARSAVEKNYSEKAVEVDMMKDSLDRMREAGEAVWAFAEERKSSKFINYEIQHRAEMEQLRSLKQAYDDLDRVYLQEVPKSYIVSRATPPSKPTFPKKGTTALAAAILSTLLMLSFERLKNKPAA
ncbi:MAG: hypothetical protein MRY83_05510 [Flavobacteriales bacterium]|nr:hypothetical protein [Flavobacteriales bacterium]